MLFNQIKALSAPPPILTALAIFMLTPLAYAQPGIPQDRFIFVITDNAGPPDEVAAEVALKSGGRIGYVYDTVLNGFSITMPRSAAIGLLNDPRIASIEEDIPVSISAQTIPTGVERIFADNNTQIGIDEIDDYRVDADVAILDTGIDLEHPDLNVVGGSNCLQSESGGPPWSRTFYCDPNTSADDDHYHGTHVAGSVAAIDNGEGVVGVAPGARLWAVKVLDSQGSGYMSGIVAGVDWAAAAGVQVINMSLGGSGTSEAMNEAIKNAYNAGVLTVVAAGNSDDEAANYTPANAPYALTVSALADFDGDTGEFGSPTCRDDQDDSLADFSNWSARGVVDIAAPGVCILSTYPIEQGSYGTISGTSMASPHVAGAAALLASNGDAPDAIWSTLTTKANHNWTDDSSDGFKEPLLDVSDTTTFTPTLVATDVSGGENISPGDGGSVRLETSSLNYGSSWTAIVSTSDNSTLSGKWSTGDICAPLASSCSLNGIPKKQSSVNFDSSYGSVTISKP